MNIFDSFEIYLSALDEQNKESIILGDFNCNTQEKHSTSHTSKLEYLYDEYQYKQLIKEPTRITKTSQSLIDHLITTAPHRIRKSGVCHLSISDHSLIYAVRRLISPRERPRIIETVNYKNFHINDFVSDIHKVSWGLIEEHDDPNEMWCIWKALFNKVLDTHAPIKTKRVRNVDAPWITSDLKVLMFRRDNLKKRAVKNRSEANWQAYQCIRNKVNREIKTTKREFFVTNLDKNKGNTKKTWKLLNNLLNKPTKMTTVNVVKNDSRDVTDPVEISENFNNHFIDIGPNLEKQIPNPTCDSMGFLKQTRHSFKFKHISAGCVANTIRKIPSNKASGLDRIPCSILKSVAGIVSEPLSKIFNKSILSGIFPDDLKAAKVSPIYKSGGRSNVNNYRPISVLSVISKIFEKIVFYQFYDYLSVNNLLSESQSGFRPCHSTLTALLKDTMYWLSNMDDGKINIAVFVDLKKAFDTVDHDILINKMKFYGIYENELSWFHSYLSNRTQRCFVNGALSTARTIKCGVPQGSILGPLLFLVFINDLPGCLSYTIPSMYADDTSITLGDSNVTLIENKINTDLAGLNEWLKANRLSLNTVKSEYMLIGSAQRIGKLTEDPSLFIGNVKLKRVKCKKSLGLVIDENLNWHDHVDGICKKVKSGLGILRRTRDTLPIDLLSKIFNAIVQPHFDYCSTVWDNCNKSHKDKLQKLQNRAARIITRSGYETRSAVLLELLGWKKLEDRWKTNKAVVMYKIANNLVPSYLSEGFTKRDTVHGYNIRSNHVNFSIPKPNTNFLKCSIAYSGAVAWNSIADETRTSVNIDVFKNNLRY